MFVKGKGYTTISPAGHAFSTTVSCDWRALKNIYM